jgi:hypothetical protein
MPGRELGEPQIMYARAQRKRLWIAVLIRKTEDMQACLRGAVSGVQKKEKDRELQKIAPGLNSFCTSSGTCVPQTGTRIPHLSFHTPNFALRIRLF